MDEMETKRKTVMPGQEGKVVQLGVNSLRASNRRALAKTKEDLVELDQRETNILGIYGDDIKKDALNEIKREQKQEQQTQNPPYTPTKTEKKTKTEDVLKPERTGRQGSRPSTASHTPRVRRTSRSTRTA